MLHGLLLLSDEPTRRKAQRLAAVGLLGNYLLNPFEREGDHWSLFRGWTMVAAHQAWFAEKAGLLDKDWKPSFDLAKGAALERLAALSIECQAPKAFVPQDNEIDDYTRARNLTLAGALSVSALIGGNESLQDTEQSKQLLEMLIRKDRLFAWGESAVPHLLALQWYAEKQQMVDDAIPSLESVISELCERNHTRAEDQFFPPPLKSADDVLADLFTSDSTEKPNRRAPGTWSLETLIEFLARRNQRQILEQLWRQISRLDMVSFQPDPSIDGLLWKSPLGHEALRKPEKTQSWEQLKNRASEDCTEALPQVLRKDLDFALMFMLVYPHRLSRELIRLLDARHFKQKDG